MSIYRGVLVFITKTIWLGKVGTHDSGACYVIDCAYNKDSLYRLRAIIDSVYNKTPLIEYRMEIRNIYTVNTFYMRGHTIE